MPRKGAASLNVAAVLEEFRAREKPEPLAAVARRAEAIALLAAWPPHDLVWHRPTSRAPGTADERWLWLWSHAEMSVPEFVASCGCQLGAGVATFEALVNLRLVYPDGTRSLWATNLVKSSVKQALGVL